MTEPEAKQETEAVEKPDFTELPIDVANTIFRIPRPDSAEHLVQELYCLLNKAGDRLGLMVRDRMDSDYSFVIFAVKEQRCGQLDLAASIRTVEEADATMRRWMGQTCIALKFRTWLEKQEYHQNDDIIQLAQSLKYDKEGFWKDWPKEGHIERICAYVLHHKQFGAGDAGGIMTQMLGDSWNEFIKDHPECV